MRFSLWFLFILFSPVLIAQDSNNNQPKTQSTVIEQNNAKQNETKENIAADKEPNTKIKEIYERFCIVCHQDGLAGAPKIGDEKDWKPRLTGKTIDDLLSSVNNGLNVMPAKGTCVECSDEELKAAIRYMLPKNE